MPPRVDARSRRTVRTPSARLCQDVVMVPALEEVRKSLLNINKNSRPEFCAN